MLLYVVDASIVYQTAGTVDSQLNCSVESSMIYKNNFSVSNFPFSLITCPLKHEEQVARIKFNIHALLGKIVKATDLSQDLVESLAKQMNGALNVSPRKCIDVRRLYTEANDSYNMLSSTAASSLFTLSLNSFRHVIASTFPP